MDKEATFLQSLQEQPHDQVRRFVYADWLEEQGEELHADFLRLHWALRALPPDHPHRVNGEQELSIYRKDLAEDWLAIVEPENFLLEDERLRWSFCECVNSEWERESWTELQLHCEAQDTECDAWKCLLDRIEEAASDERETFSPFGEMPDEYRLRIITLPPSISNLKKVKVLICYHTHLTRIPPEIGEMDSLERFIPYTSYGLHWFPYEITRCSALVDSTVSTRALYGNYKYRPPFPRLRPWADLQSETQGLVLKQFETTFTRNCSVCNQPFEDFGHHRVWISLPVATDVLPLLVNACSQECIGKLPKPPKTYVQYSHRGGLGVEQPGVDTFNG